jgi:integrase
MSKALTDASVRKLKGEATRREVRDGMAQGLYLVIQPSGAKSWALRFRRPDGSPAKLTLGPVDFSGREPTGELVVGTPLSLAAARALAAEQHRQRKRGIDIAESHRSERQKLSLSKGDDGNFGSLARRFIDEHARPHTRRWNDTARLIGLAYSKELNEPTVISGSLAHRWKARSIASISADDLYRAVDEGCRQGIPGLARRRKGPSNAQGRALAAALSKLFAWALEHRLITSSPALHVYKPPAPQPRDRVLSDHEIFWFWLGCDQLGEPYSSLFKLLFLTGARLNEVARMTTDELTDNGFVWTIPGKRTKNRRSHKLPLSTLAHMIVRDALSNSKGSHWVFTTNSRAPISGWSKLKRRLDKALKGIASEDCEGSSAHLQPWRLHDLRRTAVTKMADLRVAPHIIEAIVNHVSGYRVGVAGVYNHAEHWDEKKSGLERLSRFVGLISSAGGLAAHELFVKENTHGTETFKNAIAGDEAAWSTYVRALKKIESRRSPNTARAA